MKKVCCLILVLTLLLCGCGGDNNTNSAAAREFTDSTGRTLTIPEPITKIAITGPLSQVYIIPLAGDMLVGVSNAYAEDAALYLPDYIFEKTEIGQLYGGKGEMDLEALLSAAPDVVIDIGEPKKTMADDLDTLTEQTGIPFIHIDATVATAPEAYRTLGELLYPDYTHYDFQTEITEYYRLFYGCELTDEMYQSLIANALPGE